MLTVTGNEARKTRLYTQKLLFSAGGHLSTLLSKINNLISDGTEITNADGEEFWKGPILEVIMSHLFSELFFDQSTQNTFSIQRAYTLWCISIIIRSYIVFIFYSD